MFENIINFVRAGYSGLFIVSPEEARVEAEIKTVAERLKYRLYAWSVTSGLIDTGDGQNKGAQDPLEAVQAIHGLPENSIVLLRDFHVFLADPNPILCRALKDALLDAKTQAKVLIFVGCRQVLPPELEREITMLEFRLPDKAQLGIVLDSIAESANMDKPANDDRGMILDAATGLTTMEAENAFALSVVERKCIVPEVVAREKAATVKKNGLLEICEVKEGLSDIGGLDVLKDWLIKRKDAFSQRAVDYGLPSPKGLLIIGIPGTGKSLTAKATASVFGRPLLKMDAGRLFGSLVGQSESNLRSVIQTAEAIAPCILWIDEIEKGFAGSKSSGMTDGGTSSRVFGSFVSWMQDKKAPVFVVATANDVSALPPELLRKGRFDELFFVDLPNQAEREIIWGIQIAKYRRNAAKYDLTALAKASDGLTGSEIEQVFVDALYAAFAENNEPTDLTVSLVLNDMVPLSKLMAEQISGLRAWSKGRARPAASQSTHGKSRKIAA
jgi:ATP-dependent 26S proteasome regulatory subunit